MYNDTPDDLVHDLVAQASYQSHPLGYSILGTEEVLSELSRERLLEYIEERYTPENTVITVAGNFDEQVLERIRELFSGFSRKAAKMEIPYPFFTPSTIVRCKETEQAHLCLSLKGYPIGDSRMYSLILMNNILGGSMSSRLFQEIREERGLSYSVFSYHTAFKETGLFTIYTGTTPAQLGETFEVIATVLRTMRQNGISQEELNKGKEQLKGSLMLSLESTNSRMSRLGKNELLLGKHLSLDEIIEKVEAITVESVQEVATDILSQPMSISLVSPLENLPDTVRGDVLV
jgi:predicted Zn-dependent peptidase